MATSYIFNFTDPWTVSFNVNAFSTNGPVFPLSLSLESTAVAANTSFLLYGKGSPNYGERIQENIVHLLETMSGNVEPTYPISGQQWFLRYDVILTGSGWFEWNASTLGWDAFTPTALPIVVFTHGEFFTDGAGTPEITRVINVAGHPLSPSAVVVNWQDLSSIGDPNTAEGGGVMQPQIQLQVFNGETWDVQNSVRSSVVEPTGAQTGDLWFDENLPSQLKIWDGGTWISVAANYLLLTGGTMSGDIAMAGNEVLGLPAPSVGDAAANRDYVDAAVGSSVNKLDDLLDVTFGTPDADPSLATPFLRHDSALVVLQTETSFTGVGNFGSFVGGTGYAGGDTITLSGGQLITVGSEAGGVVLTFAVSSAGNNAADGVPLIQTGTSGIGTGFILTPGIVNVVGWKASLLVLSDLSDVTSTIAQVNYLNTSTSDIQIQLDGIQPTSINGKLNLDGTNVMAATLDMGSNFIVSVLNPINPQDAATKFFVEDHVATEIAAIGGTDTFVTGASLNTIIGNPEEGWFTIEQANGVLPADIIIAGFAVQGHTHPSEDIPHTPLSSSNLSLNPVPPTNVKDTFFQLEEQTRLRTQPRRFVQTLGGAGSGPFAVPDYEPGRHKLQVFLNGVKLIADEMAFAAALFVTATDGAADSGLVASTLYDINFTVDGVGPTNVSWTTAAFAPPDFYDFIDLQNDINIALGLAAIGATCVFQDGALEFYSDLHGATAAIVVAAGTGNDVFAAITGGGGFSGFDTPTGGVDHGYRETGFYGDTDLESTITTIAALGIGDVLEAIVLGDSGIA